MDNSQRSIPYRTMGNDRSKLSYESENFNTEYDSTWEDDDDDCEDVQSSKSELRWSYRTYRNSYAARDMQNFRHMVPIVQCDDTDHEELKKSYSEEKLSFPNLWFYQNKMRSRPDGVSIEEFHSVWFGDYRRLEMGQTYIQWLFPIQEQESNYEAHVLTPVEIKVAFRKDEMAKDRLLKSYRLMLDFYGIELCNEETGEVCRADNWKERFENLDRNTHNNLCITRILKCLGILGFQHYQAPLARFFLEETLVKENLPRVKRRVLDYFMFAVLDRSERQELIRFAFMNFEPKDEFVWCPKRIQRRFYMEITNRAAHIPVSDSYNVSEELLNQRQGSNISQDATGDLGKMSVIQTSDNKDDSHMKTDTPKQEHLADMHSSEDFMDTGEISISEPETIDVEMCADGTLNVPATTVTNEEHVFIFSSDTSHKCEQVQPKSQRASAVCSEEAGVRWPTSSDL